MTTSSASAVTPAATSTTFPFCQSSTEDVIAEEWASVRFTNEESAAFSSKARDDLHRAAESGGRPVTDQRRRLAELQRHQQKLLDAVMADALPVDILKTRQAQVSAEIADANRLIANAQTHSTELFSRLDQLTNLLTHADELYASCADEGRELLNRAVFEVFHIDRKRQHEGSGAVVTDAPLTPVFDAVVAGIPSGRHEKPPTGLTCRGFQRDSSGGDGEI